MLTETEGELVAERIKDVLVQAGMPDAEVRGHTEAQFYVVIEPTAGGTEEFGEWARRPLVTER